MLTWILNDGAMWLGRGVLVLAFLVILNATMRGRRPGRCLRRLGNRIRGRRWWVVWGTHHHPTEVGSLWDTEDEAQREVDELGGGYWHVEEEGP